ncbi:hypothetical protein E3E33_09805 [Thermococcus sp. GR5]|uniref:hypothetical protein n=1 Tax=unclassified Thermococcus TaxID=2627626 RepID=UPI001430ABC6|nr:MULTISPECIES: hypothetical protein [unclassified Thermococcus]NJF23867.1 hypothetical protein [Thermococcus sp. GR5]
MYVNPPYVSKAMAHFAGDMAVLEEIGTLNEKSVEIIKESLGAKGNEIDLSIGDLILIPVERLPEDDRKLLLKVAQELGADAKLKIVRR